MIRFLVALLFVMLAAAPSLAADEPFAIGRILVIDGAKSFVIAQFPTGQRLLHIERGDLWRYRVGDEIRVDSFGRIRS